MKKIKKLRILILPILLILLTITTTIFCPKLNKKIQQLRQASISLKENPIVNIAITKKTRIFYTSNFDPEKRILDMEITTKKNTDKISLIRISFSGRPKKYFNIFYAFTAYSINTNDLKKIVHNTNNNNKITLKILLTKMLKNTTYEFIVNMLQIKEKPLVKVLKKKPYKDIKITTKK